MPMYSVDDLAFDPVTHTSRLPDGRDVPHVTTILSEVGVATDFDELAAFGPRMASMIEHARQLGSAVHADTHALDDDDLDWATVDVRVFQFIEAWAQCKADKGLVPLVHGRERRVFNPIHGYTGIPDGVFRCIQTGRIVLGDLKTGNPESAAAHLQTAAYQIPWDLAHTDDGLQICERWAIWLRPGRRVPYTIINYSHDPDGWQDFSVFMACLATFNAQPGRRRKRA